MRYGLLFRFRRLLTLLRLYDDPAFNAEVARRQGATIGKNVAIKHSFVDANHCALLTIGDNVTITGATLLMHDASCGCALGYGKVGRVTIGDDVFVGAGAIILPNVTIGSRVVVGAGAVVARDIPDNSVAVGNPARVVCSYDEFAEKHRQALERGPRFETRAVNMTPAEKAELFERLEHTTGYIR